MNRDFIKEMKMHNYKRVTALIVALVFVFGTMCVPAELYAVENEAVETQAAVTEEATTEPANEEPAAEEAVEPTEAAAPETTEATSVPEETNEDVVNDLSEALTVDLDSVDEDAYDGFIYKLEDNTTKKEIKEMETAIDDLAEEQEVTEVIEKEIYEADSIETIEEVADADIVEYIEPNYYVEALGTNDPYYSEYGWYLEMIKAPYVWERGEFGSGVTVAVLDSGVNLKHPDFENTKFEKQYNATTDSTDVADLEDVTDRDGHGSWVVGIIAASYNNGKGLTGIMPEATIMPVKVLDKEIQGKPTGDITDVVKGIDHAVNNGAHVINMSFGGEIDSISLKNACDRAAAAGVILVAAAGNDGDSTIEYPASYDSVISVGSVERDENHSSFSSYNNYVDVTAPGRGIFVTGKLGGYGTTSGTSFSSPQVAAMAIMAKSMDKSVNVSGFRDVIAYTSKDKGAAGRDCYFGYGIMDLSKAYRYINGDISLYPMALSTTSYVYNNGVKTPSVTVRKSGRALSSNCYTVTYPSGRKAVGTYKVIISGRGSYNGSKTLSFNIVPPLIKSIKSPQRYKGKLKVRWYKMSKSQRKKYKNVITGYQVRVSTYKNFAYAKYANVRGITKTAATVKGLKKKTTYYVQYRSYKVVGSTTYYSKWSGKKKAKTK